MATIKNNALKLPDTFYSANGKTCIRKIQEKKEEKLPKAAHLSFPYRDSIVKECFQYELNFLHHSPMAEKCTIKKIRFTK